MSTDIVIKKESVNIRKLLLNKCIVHAALKYADDNNTKMCAIKPLSK